MKRVHAGFANAYDAASCRRHSEHWHLQEPMVGAGAQEMRYRYSFASTAAKTHQVLPDYADWDDQQVQHQYYRCKY